MGSTLWWDCDLCGLVFSADDQMVNVQSFPIVMRCLECAESNPR